MTLDGFPAASVHLLTAEPRHLWRSKTFYISDDFLLAWGFFFFLSEFDKFFFLSSFLHMEWRLQRRVSSGESVRHPTSPPPPVTSTGLSTGQQVEPREQKALLQDVSAIMDAYRVRKLTAGEVL